MFGPSREQVRALFFDAWYKYQHHKPCSRLEATVITVILQHPEYQELLAQRQQYLHHDYRAENNNPFLHLSLHLALAEQLSINQPIGITQLYQRLCERHHDHHEVQHQMLDCLAEILWEIEQTQTSLTSEHYFAKLQRLS